MTEQLEIDDAEVAAPRAPDPWPEIRALHPGQPIARRIYVDALEQEWLVLEGESAELYDGSTHFLYTPRRSESPSAEEQAEIIEQFNRLWLERPSSSPHDERRA